MERGVWIYIYTDWSGFQWKRVYLYIYICKYMRIQGTTIDDRKTNLKFFLGKDLTILFAVNR